ncbi:ATP-NAD kinase family protein [Tindallia californiensis]|uniref:ATP-NAD kinase n=1 Tax=Tindallia californiensis TaxID=159292 RepID=A0A1H3R9F9_9FIRM|nr:NAD(+)/NADH kinase [Tindallia californiensis]SDZ21609.1 ATP-NAD kinase [Tindallia californiensis]
MRRKTPPALPEMGFHYTLIDSGEKIKTETSAKDTCYTAEEMLRESVDLILFADGDGTARDLFQAVGENLPVIGIPAGVKIHSPVYATSLEEAGKLACRYLIGTAKRLKSAEVLDIDEEAYRKGQVHTHLYGYLRIPDTLNLMQGKKAAVFYPKNPRKNQLHSALRIIWKRIFYTW